MVSRVTFCQLAPQMLPESQFCTKAYSLSDIRSISMVAALEMAVDIAMPTRSKRRGESPCRVSERK